MTPFNAHLRDDAKTSNQSLQLTAGRCDALLFLHENCHIFNPRSLLPAVAELCLVRRMKRSMVLSYFCLWVALGQPINAQEPPSTSEDNRSISPDKQWEYNGGRIVKAGTTQVVLDLDEELEVYDPETEILWAPDSKRFGFNYGPLHAHHTTYKTVAFYQLRAEKWVGLRSPEDDLVKLGKELLPKKVHKSRDELIPSIVKVRNWTDAGTVILFSAWRPWQFSTHSNQLKAAFLLTLEFDENGNWKIVKKHRLSEKEIEQFNSED